MFIILIILVAAVAAVYLYSARGGKKAPLPHDEDSPWETINRQYARGEIDRDELQRRRTLLEGGRTDSNRGDVR